MTNMTRRRVLRGMLAGGALNVGLPFLECFLNNSGTALADGAPLPTRFGVWVWHLGVTPGRWVPTKVGPDYELTPQLETFKNIKSKTSILSGFDVPLDGKPHFPHQSGGQAFRTGIAPPAAAVLAGPTFDTMIADKIGVNSRFRTLDLSAALRPADTLSGRGPGNLNTPESSAMSVYQRMFGADFNPDPEAFKPSPAVMVNKSVLSGITEDRKTLVKSLGSADRQRLDQYFTAVRQVEHQLALQLQKPERMLACKAPTEPEKLALSNDMEVVRQNQEILTQLLIMALACDQTRAFNLYFSNGNVTNVGSATGYHQLTHEEVIDPKLGVQPRVVKFVEASMRGFSDFIGALDAFKEGDGSLLDNCFVVAHSDLYYAKEHVMTGFPMMTAGSGGGKFRTGVHIDGKGAPASRLALTAMQGLGVAADRFGAQSLETRQPLSELLA